MNVIMVPSSEHVSDSRGSQVHGICAPAMFNILEEYLYSVRSTSYVNEGIS